MSVELPPLPDARKPDENGVGWFTANQMRAYAAEALQARKPLTDELLKSLEGMCSVWVTVCNSKGWDPEHMTQYVNARSTIAAVKEKA